MGFIMDGLGAEEYDRTYSDRILVGRIASYFRPHAKTIAWVVTMMTAYALTGLVVPLLISAGIDALSMGWNIRIILLFAGGISVAGLGIWIFNYGRMLFAARITGNVVLKMRGDVFKATINHDLSFFDAHPSGKIVSRITSDTQEFAGVVSLIIDLFGQTLLMGIFLTWLFFIHPGLTLILILTIPLTVGIALTFRKMARTVTRQARRVTALINSQIQESISGIMVAKSFRREGTIFNTFMGNNHKGYQAGLRRGAVLSSIYPVMGLTSNLAMALLILVGGPVVKSGSISPGDWFLYMQSVPYVLFPILSIASFWSQFQNGLSSSERVFGLIDAQPRVIQTASHVLTNLCGEIQFQNLKFEYTSGQPVLPDFSLEIRSGETLALVGHTGAGKSSIVKLLGRFYEFSDGQLLIDGLDIRSLDLNQYRRQVGFVPQEPFLFSGTVADNIRFGNPDADFPMVLAAAEGLGGGEWISALKQGLDTDVGERGARLSMGQRQLVALARILLKDPAIFILDEATASVDPFTEIQIKEGLETLVQDRTAIIIAHRLSTVCNADRIIVIQKGCIAEEGKHTELMQSNGHYAELYHTYFRHQTLKYINNAQNKTT